VTTPRRSLALLGLAFVLAACTSATPSSLVPVPAGALEVRAENLSFSPSRLSTAAGKPFQLYFDNADSVPHNVVIIGPDDSRVFTGDVFSGAGQRVFQVPALAAGTYRLRCDLHPEMEANLKLLLQPA
jgi:plastocyanin